MKTIKFDTKANKKAYVDSLINTLPNINPDYNVYLFSKNHGVYSGVVRTYLGKGITKYYGFIINFPDQYFKLEGVSGKELVNSASNLQTVFSNEEALNQQGLDLLVVVGRLLSAQGDEYSSNLGRGIYRAITKYPVSEQIYINFKRKTSAGIIYDAQNLFDNSKEAGDKSFSLRKEWGLSKANFKLAKEFGIRGIEYDGSDNLNQRLSLLREARKYVHEIDEERGYHDADEWFSNLYYSFVLDGYGYYSLTRGDAYESYYVPRIYTASKYLTKDKQAWMHIVKYFYGSLYHQQAITSFGEASRCYLDYVNLVKDYKNWVHFPRYLKVAHDIAVRNDSIMEHFSDENSSNSIINQYLKYHNLEGQYDKYNFILASTAEEIVEEGQLQSNCVSGYVNSVARGGSIIMFLRKDDVQKSWVTIELRSRHNTLEMTQVFETFNAPLGEESKNILHAWAKLNNIKVALNIGGCPDTSSWDKDYKQRIMGLKPFNVNPHKEDLSEQISEYERTHKDLEAKKLAMMNTLEKESLKMTKAV